MRGTSAMSLDEGEEPARALSFGAEKNSSGAALLTAPNGTRTKMPGFGLVKPGLATARGAEGRDDPAPARDSMTALPREAREGLMRAWVAILKERHPEATWIPGTAPESSEKPTSGSPKELLEAA